MYQPKVSLSKNGEHYVEALVRWQHPSRGIGAADGVHSVRRADGFDPSDHALGRRARAVAQCAAWRRAGGRNERPRSTSRRAT
jgi:EAL domain-containing protein (putative c-di-GMP-specific phosphodiesterase class I)